MSESPQSHREPARRPPDGPELQRPVRRKTAAQRKKDRMRVMYIVVAIILVLFLLSGVFATAVPVG